MILVVLSLACWVAAVLADDSSAVATMDTSLPQPNGVSCQYSLGGVNWDLRPLQGSTDLQGNTADRYSYIMNPCGGAGGICAGNQNEPMVCQGAPAGGLESVIAYMGVAKTPPPAWELIDPTNAGKGVRLTFKNGDYCWDSQGNIRTAIVNFICDPSAGARPAKFDITESPTCTFTINYRNSVSCPGSGGDSGGMSGGSVFLLLLFIFLVLYIGGGCLYKRKKMGTTGWRESCPNYDFWSVLPFYVKEGILYTRRKVSALAKGNAGRTTYDQL